MTIRYELDGTLDGKTSMHVIFLDENDKRFHKYINIPRNEDGSLNEDLWNERLEEQLNGVISKLEKGSIEFKEYDPPVGPTNAMDIMPEEMKTPR